MIRGGCLCGAVAFEIRDDLPRHEAWPPGEDMNERARTLRPET